MEFFHSLTPDLKVLIIAIAGCALLALFSGSHTREKRYMLLLAVLTAAGVYRFTRFEQSVQSASAAPEHHFVTVSTKHKPLESTAAK